MDFAWVFFALISSMFVASISEVNRYFKMDGARLNFWRTTMTVVWLLPAVLLMDFNPSYTFVIGGLFMGWSMFICMNILMSLAAEGQGRASQLYNPIKAFWVFIAWLVIDNIALQRIIDDPLRTFLILLCFASATLAMQLIRNNDTSWKVIIRVIPVVILFGLSDIIIKFVMPTEVNLSAAIMLVWLGNLGCSLSGLVYLSVRHAPEKPLLPPRMLRAAFVVGIVGFGGFVTINLALAGSPNPAYVGVIGFLTPFWLQLYHRLLGLRDDANTGSMILLVASATGLIFVTSFM